MAGFMRHVFFILSLVVGSTIAPHQNLYADFGAEDFRKLVDVQQRVTGIDQKTNEFQKLFGNELAELKRQMFLSRPILPNEKNDIECRRQQIQSQITDKQAAKTLLQSQRESIRKSGLPSEAQLPQIAPLNEASIKIDGEIKLLANEDRMLLERLKIIDRQDYALCPSAEDSPSKAK